MRIKKAKREDMDEIVMVLNAARKTMRENGNATQWSNGYPSPKIILNDINENHAFVCVEREEVVGYFCFMKGDNPDPNYEIIENGEWLNDAPYGVIHRLASNRKVKGIAEKAFEFAFSKIDNLRVDTHHDNVPMQNFLKKIGFAYCGVIYVGDGTPRDAFQKKSKEQ